MKRIISLITCIAFVLSIVGCADRMTIDGVTYDTYGVVNVNEKANPNIQYEIAWGNVFWGVVLCETIIAPIYFFGFSLYEPMGRKTAIKGEVAR